MLKLLTAIMVLFLVGQAGATSSDLTLIMPNTTCKHDFDRIQVNIEIDKNSYFFEPLCGFKFEDKFTTKSGVECEIEAGMCSSFFPRQSFEISCDNGGRAAFSLNCLN